MNIVFWLCLVAAMILFWFLFAFAFRGIGKFWHRIYDDARKEIQRKDEETQKKRRK